jgi:hypothetical protein
MESKEYPNYDMEQRHDPSTIDSSLMMPPTGGFFDLLVVSS